MLLAMDFMQINGALQNCDTKSTSNFDFWYRASNAEFIAVDFTSALLGF